MNVQSDILMQLLKDKNMSQAQLARESGVTENTISSWKKDGHDANKSCVERVAKALGTTVKKLTTIAQGDDKKRVDQAAELELISYHYGVSTNTILRLAPMLFSVIARRALKKRNDELDEWYKNLRDAVKLPSGIKPYYDHYKSSDDELSYSSFAETYWEERKRRESGDLSVDEYDGIDVETLPKFSKTMVNNELVELPEHEHTSKYGTDLFFQTLLEIDTGDEIGDCDDETANLKNYEEEESFLYSNDIHDIATQISDDNWDAADYLQDGTVRLKEIPTALFEKGKSQERVDWILKKGKAYVAQRNAEYEKREAQLRKSKPSLNSDGGKDA